MPTIAKTPEGGQGFAPIPAGSYAARCVHLIQLGTQEREYNGETSSAFKVMLSWEIPDERVTTKDGRDMPKLVSKEYTLSLHEKATLRADLKSWRSVDFTEEEAKGFDIEKLIGAPCLLSILHSQSAKGKTYAKIGAIMRLPTGMTAKPQEHESLAYHIDEGRGGVYPDLPEWIQKKIDASEEMTLLGRSNVATGERLDPSQPLPNDTSDLPF